MGSSKCDERDRIGARHILGALAVVAEDDEAKRVRTSNWYIIIASVLIHQL